MWRGRKENMYDRGDRALSAPLADFDHAVIRRCLRLREQAERKRTGHFQIEGLRFLVQAAEQGFPIHSLLICPRSPTWRPECAKIAVEVARHGVSVYEISPVVLARVANSEDPRGLIAITSQNVLSLDQVTPTTGLCWLAVDELRSPGNLGTLLRTSECVGGAGLIVLGSGADPYDPACVRATMGAIFRQRIVFATFDELREWARRHRASIVGTSPSASTDYRSVELYAPSVILLGSERHGLSSHNRSQCNVTVRIPMAPDCRGDSLNVGVAGSLLLYEAFHQRRRGTCRNRTGCLGARREKGRQ